MRFLELRGKLERVRRHHAIVMIGEIGGTDEQEAADRAAAEKAAKAQADQEAADKAAAAAADQATIDAAETDRPRCELEPRS